MDSIETTILKNLIHNDEYSRKVIPFIDKEYFYFVPRLINHQPYRIFTSILTHANLNHLLSNLGGIIITRYFLMRLGIKSRFFYVKFILICSFLNFFINLIINGF